MRKFMCVGMLVAFLLVTCSLGKLGFSQDEENEVVAALVCGGRRPINGHVEYHFSAGESTDGKEPVIEVHELSCNEGARVSDATHPIIGTVTFWEVILTVEDGEVGKFCRSSGTDLPVHADCVIEGHGRTAQFTLR